MNRNMGKKVLAKQYIVACNNDRKYDIKFWQENISNGM